MLAKLFRDFMLIWTTVDPIGSLALFAGLTASLTRAERKRVARRATIYAAIILVGAVVAGPGTIMAVIVLTDNDVYTIPEQAATAGILLIVLAMTYGLFLASEAILKVIGRQGASILVRVMGILLAALSVELVMNALAIPPWASLPKP